MNTSYLKSLHLDHVAENSFFDEVNVTPVEEENKDDNFDSNTSYAAENSLFDEIIVVKIEEESEDEESLSNKGRPE